MTGVILVIVPSMVAMGTSIGSILRVWSREAQQQVAIATSVADEAISNVRTVRAFAMEEKEAKCVCVCVCVCVNVYCNVSMY